MESFDSPPALRPIYSTSEPNQPIQLYQGSLEITQKGAVIKGNGILCIQWLPSPAVRFEFLSHDNWSCEIHTSEASLKLLDLTTPVSVEVYILSFPLIPLSSENSISGCLREEAVISQPEQELSHVLFHLINFDDFRGTRTTTSEQWGASDSRAVLEAEGWRVTIDFIETCREIIESLESQVGYAITHVGKLERCDKKAFTGEEADKLLEALSGFLPFARGKRTFLILPVGYNVSKEQVWEKWAFNQIATSWKDGVYSWFPKRGQSLSQVFPGFLRRWQDPTWNESIRLAIHWYLESNAQAGAVQGSIILLQTALELLAWVFLVEEVGISVEQLRDKDNEKYNSTSRKINRLLEKLGIPQEIPPSLSGLTKFASTLKDSKNNGSYTLSEVRNSIVHAAPENRDKFRNIPFPAMCEAYDLGLWYLELILLRLFKYKGDYYNRIAKKEYYRENIEAVP